MDEAAVTGPRRRPPEGGYARGEETRERIIDAAFVVFADEGYRGASTRRIAAEAGVNPPALQYYFDSKEGLHRACGETVVARVMAHLAEPLEAARKALAGQDREPAVEALCSLVGRMAEFAMVSHDDETWSRFHNRCQGDDIGPAFEVMDQGIAKVLMSLCVELVARSIGRPADEPLVRLKGLLIMGQIAPFHAKRASMLKFMGWPDFDGDRLDLTRDLLCDHVRRLVTP
ncbi:MAG TPA: CerR family C-terminal domain-containing protein [Caulobacteraceae bacterium]|jgi:AcrR family transcriptional regulator|nr:CerR family C-terminal domain-containing protein [Caulobacteraceae bacterium]